MKQAEEREHALLEAQQAFNQAKAAGRETVTLSRRSLYLLLVLAAHVAGYSVHDVKKLS